MIVIPIVSGLIGVGQSYLNNVIGQNVMQDLRNALYAHLQRLPLRFFTATRTGEIQSRLANDVGGVQAVVTDTASSITSNIAITVSTVIAMLLLSWQLTLLSLGITPFFMYLTYRVGKVRREVSKETQERLAEMSAVTEETLSVSGILLGKTFAAQERSVERFRGLNKELARLQIRQAMVGRWFFMVIGTIFSIMPAFVYWLAGTMAANGSPDAPTAGDIVAFTTLQSRLFFPLGQLLNVQVEIQGSLALFDRIFEYLDLDPEIVGRARRGRRSSRTRSGAPSRSRACRSTTSPSRAPPGRRSATSPPPWTSRRARASPRPCSRMRTRSRTHAEPEVAEAVPRGRAAARVRPRGPLVRGAAGRAGRAGRPVGRRQDDDDLPDPAPVRRDRRAGSRSTASTSARSSSSPWAG